MERMVHLIPVFCVVLLALGSGCTEQGADGTLASSIFQTITDAIASGVTNAITGLVQAGLLTLLL